MKMLPGVPEIFSIIITYSLKTKKFLAVRTANYFTQFFQTTNTLTHLYFILMDCIIHVIEWVSRQWNIIWYRISPDLWSVITHIVDVSLGKSQVAVSKCNFFPPVEEVISTYLRFAAVQHFCRPFKTIQLGMNFSILIMRTVIPNTWIYLHDQTVCLSGVSRNLNHNNHNTSHRSF